MEISTPTSSLHVETLLDVESKLICSAIRLIDAIWSDFRESCFLGPSEGPEEIRPFSQPRINTV